MLMMVIFPSLQEVTVPSHVQSLQMFNEKLCVGYQSGFSLFHVYVEEPPQRVSSNINTIITVNSEYSLWADRLTAHYF